MARGTNPSRHPIPNGAKAVTAMVAWALGILGPGAALAQTEAVRLVYRAPPECPDAAVFLRQVVARLPRIRLAPAGDPARTFTIAMSPDTGSYRGLMTLTDVDGATSVREVAAATCEEAVSLLAVVAALAVDPRAPLGALPPPTATPAAPPPPAATVAADRAGPGPKTPSAFWAWSVGLQGGAISGPSPALQPSAALFVDLARESGRHFDAALRLTVWRAQGGTWEGGAGAASFDLTAASLQGCPLTLRPKGGRLAARFCVAIDAGMLRGRGSRIASPETHSLLWLAPGLVSRATWSPGRHVFIEAQGGASFPLTRASFHFDRPLEEVHAVGRVALLSAVGAGLRFP